MVGMSLSHMAKPSQRSHLVAAGVFFLQSRASHFRAQSLLTFHCQYSHVCPEGTNICLPFQQCCNHNVDFSVTAPSSQDATHTPLAQCWKR